MLSFDYVKICNVCLHKVGVNYLFIIFRLVYSYSSRNAYLFAVLVHCNHAALFVHDVLFLFVVKLSPLRIVHHSFYAFFGTELLDIVFKFHDWRILKHCIVIAAVRNVVILFHFRVDSMEYCSYRIV